MQLLLQQVVSHARCSRAGDNGADDQLDAVEPMPINGWLAGRDGLMLGDINGTLCSHWRSGDSNAQTAMDKRLRQLVGWRCHCKAGTAVCKAQLTHGDERQSAAGARRRGGGLQGGA